MFAVLRRRAAHLRTIDKCLCVQRRGSSYRLITQSVQISDERASKVTVYYVKEEKHIFMAFCFELKNKTTIFPVVTQLGNEIEFKVLSDEELQSFDKEFLFQWAKKTGHNTGHLKSVAQPSKYLFVGSDNKVTIKSKPLTCFKIEPPQNYNRQRVQTRGFNKHIAERKMLRPHNVS